MPRIEGTVGFIGGCQKCGTSSLFHALLRHPQVRQGPKEPKLFTLEARQIEKHMGWYKEVTPVEGNRLYIDASTAYTGAPQAPRMIDKYVEDPRVLLILRDPVERAHSSYCWMHDQGQDARRFTTIAQDIASRNDENLREAEDAVLQSAVGDGVVNDGYLDETYMQRVNDVDFLSYFQDHLWCYRYFGLSQYGPIIKRYRRALGDGRVYICTLDALVEDPERELGLIFTHLGLDPVATKGGFPHRNPTEDRQVPETARPIAEELLGESVERYEALQSVV